MKFRKTLKVLAASALLFGTVGLATACGDNNGGTTDVKGLIINEDAKVIRGDFNLVDKYLGCDLTWTSSNENVAKITKGEGTYKVTITRPDKDSDVTLTATSGKYTKEFKITVPAIDVSEIAGAYTFANNKKTLKSGSYDLEAKATYSGKEATIAWAVDEAQASIAKVENGKLVITATAEKTTVTLKATFTYNNATSIKKYSVVAYDSPLGEPVLTVTPENFKTAKGIKMDKVVENTAHPEEFTMQKQGSYMTAYSTKDIKQVSIEVYGSHDNLKMYAGDKAEGDAITASVETIEGGKRYNYEFASNVNQFYVVNPSDYAVQVFSVSVYTDGILSAEAPTHFDYTNVGSTSTITFTDSVVKTEQYKEITFNKSASASMTVNNDNGVQMIVAYVFGAYDNMKLYAGTDDKGTLVKASKTEKDETGKSVYYTYILPENTKSAYFVNPSSYAVNFYDIWVYEGTTIQQPKASDDELLSKAASLFKKAYTEDATVTLSEGVTAAVKEGTTASSVTIKDGVVTIKPTDKEETVTLVLTAGEKTKEISFTSKKVVESEIPADALKTSLTRKADVETSSNDNKITSDNLDLLQYLDSSVSGIVKSVVVIRNNQDERVTQTVWFGYDKKTDTKDFRFYSGQKIIITLNDGYVGYGITSNLTSGYTYEVSADGKTITIYPTATLKFTSIDVAYKAA